MWWPLRFPNKNDIRFVFSSSCLQERACLVYVICVCLRIVVSNPYCVVSLLWFSSFCGLSFLDCPFGILERLFSLLGHISLHPAFVGFVLINLLLCLFVCFFPVVFSKSLFVICPLSFAIVSTFRGCVFSCPDIFFCAKQKSDYVIDMKYPYYFPGFTNFFVVF